MQRKANGPEPRRMPSQSNSIQRRIVQQKLAGKVPIATQSAPPVYRPQLPAIANPGIGTVMQRKANTGFKNEARPAPPVYKPGSNSAGVQAKPVHNFRVETRPAPPVYRPQAANLLAQAKMQMASVQAQSQYELSPAVWIGQGRQQIRVRAKGSPTSVGSVDLHFKQPGKAFISALEVAQAHRKHGVGSMLMKAALDSARRQGSTATMLEANPGPGSISKQALVSMYQKLGFKNTGMSRKGNPMMTVQGKMDPQAYRMASLQIKAVPVRMASQNIVQRAQQSESDEIKHVNSMTEMMPDKNNADEAAKMSSVAKRKKQYDFVQWNQRSQLDLAAKTPFHKWLDGGAAPKEMNCWEAVLYAAFLAGVVKDKEYIRLAITNTPDTATPAFVVAILRNPTKQFNPKNAKIVEAVDITDKAIPRGSVVLFGKAGEHVALATGDGHKILHLDKKTIGVEESTIKDEMVGVYADKLTWGPMPTVEALINVL